MKQTEILIAEHDKGIRNAICTTLDIRGYSYRTAQTVPEAQAALETKHPDLLLLHLSLPQGEVCQFIKSIRSRTALPIILLFEKGVAKKKAGVAALEAGADDYLIWPFTPEELTARLRAAEDRLELTSDPHFGVECFQNGGLIIDRVAGKAKVDGRPIRLTTTEYRILSMLAENVGRVLTHNTILREVWGTDLSGEAPSLRVFMTTLRRKVEIMPSQPKYIQTHIGVGYRMVQILPALAISER